MNRDDGVAAIVLAAEHLLGFARRDLGAQLVEAAREIVGDGFTRLRPLDEDREVVDAALERLAHADVVFEAAAALEELLRAGLVLPEVRVGRLLLYLLEFVGRAGGVKDSSADRMRAGRDPDTGGAARRVGGPYSICEARCARVLSYLAAGGQQRG
jgi:hypothetical protein